MLSATSQYMLAKDGQDYWIIDFHEDKAYKIIDTVVEHEGGLLDNKDYELVKDTLNIAWEQENAVVFKYYVKSEDCNKKMTYIVGKGFTASEICK